MAEDPVALTQRFAQEALHAARMDAFDALVAEAVSVTTGLSPAGPILGRSAYKEVFAGFAEAFPVEDFIVHETLPLGPDRALLRFTAVARHARDYYGIAATGRVITMHEVQLHRWQDGRLIENIVGAVSLDFEMLMAPVIGPMVLR